MTDVEFTPRAYCKMLLHCAKYPHCAVNGVLLADAQFAKEPKSKLVFTDAIPLFHICLNLTPMYEIAMSQIDNLASSQGMVIAGFYNAEENLNDTNIEPGLRIATKISEFFPYACLVTIDNQRFPSIYEGHKGKDGRELPLIVSQCADGKAFKRKDKASIVVSDKAMEKACTLLAEKIKDVIDFDNHLDNLRLDWRNPELNFAIDS